MRLDMHPPLTAYLSFLFLIARQCEPIMKAAPFRDFGVVFPS